MQCVILAGGLGTRIKGRSGDLPKALIPVLDKPFIFYQLEWLARQKVQRIVVSIGYRGAAIARAIGDGSQFGLSVAYCDEGENLRGTGGRRQQFRSGSFHELPVNTCCQRLAIRSSVSPPLMGTLAHVNGWHRDTAARLLYERRDLAAVPVPGLL